MDDNSQPQNSPQPPPQPNPFSQPVNNYSQPQQPMPQPNPAPVARIDYDSNPFIAVSKGLGQILVHNPIPALLTQLIPFALGFLLSFVDIFGQLLNLPPALRGIIMIFLIIIIIITSLKAFAAGLAIYRSSIQGQKITTQQSMNTYSTGAIARLLLTSLLAAIFIMIGFVVFIIPGLIIYARLSLLPFIVFEENISGFAAIKRSWSLTKGHVFEMWGATIASSILSGYGLLAIPATIAAFGTRYTQLKLAKDRNAQTGPVHFMNWLLVGIVIAFIALYFIFFAFLAAITYSAITVR